MTAKIVNARKAHAVWNSPHLERYVDDNFYAFSRGDFFVALTNTPNTINRSVTYHPFGEGQTVCNIFFPSDCIAVKGGVLPITLLGGEAKIFVPKTGAYFQ